MPEQKHIIWSNIDLDLDDWYDDLHEEYPALGEEGLRDMMYQYNFEYFSDAQSQLDMYVGSPILVLANLGLWDGRHRGFGEIKSGNIKDCMETDYEYAEWRVGSKYDFDKIAEMLRYYETALTNWREVREQIAHMLPKEKQKSYREITKQMHTRLYNDLVELKEIRY